MLRADSKIPAASPELEALPPSASSSEPAPRPASSAKRVWAVVGVISLIALGGVGVSRMTGRAEPPAPPPQGAAAAPVVRVTTARQGSLPLVGNYRGELIAEIAELAARSSGRLLSVNGQIGDTFKKGDLLAQVDALEPQRQVAEASAQVKAAEAATERVEAQLAAAEVELERGTRLKAEALLSDQELTALRSQVSVLKAELNAARAQHASAQARAALYREQISDARLVAPFDGAIAERYLDPGSSVQPGTPVLRLVRSGPLRVRFRVPERDLRHLAIDRPLEVTTQASGSQRFAGKLTRIAAEVSRNDRTIAVEGLLADVHEVLRPGMYANVSLTFGTLEGVTLVPSSALSERVDAEGVPEIAVFVVEEGIARRKVVQVLGQYLDDSAVEGIAPGDVVVSFGHEALRDNGPVRLADEQKR